MLIGELFKFNNNLSEEECASLQTIADSEQFKKTIDFKDHSGVLAKFLDTVKKDLGISLDPVKIAYIVRIK